VEGGGALEMVRRLDDMDAAPQLRVALVEALAVLGTDSRSRRLLRTPPHLLGELGQTESGREEEGGEHEQQSSTEDAAALRLQQRGVLWLRLESGTGMPSTGVALSVAAGINNAQRSRTVRDSANPVWKERLSFRGKLGDFAERGIVLSAVGPLDPVAAHPVAVANVSLDTLRYVDTAAFIEPLKPRGRAAQADSLSCSVNFSVRWEPLSTEELSGLQVLLAAAFETSTPELQVAAVVSMSACTTDALSAAAAVDAGAVGRLLTIVEEPHHPARVAAAACLDRLSGRHAALQLWLHGHVPASMQLESGFVDVGVGRTFAPCAEITAAGITSAAEALLVDETDAALMTALNEASRELSEYAISGTDERKVEVLASFVSRAMGGSMSYDLYERFDFSWDMEQAKVAAGSDLVPIGLVKRGAARHRALLFKALADRLGVLCELHAGRCVRGAHARHAWVVAHLRPAAGAPAPEEVVVDLLHSVGSVYALGSPDARRYQRDGEFLYSTLKTTARQPKLPQPPHVTPKLHPEYQTFEPLHTPRQPPWV